MMTLVGGLDILFVIIYVCICDLGFDGEREMEKQEVE